jgi:hypothetical protein
MESYKIKVNKRTFVELQKIMHKWEIYWFGGLSMLRANADYVYIEWHGKNWVLLWDSDDSSYGKSDRGASERFKKDKAKEVTMDFFRNGDFKKMILLRELHG